MVWVILLSRNIFEKPFKEGPWCSSFLKLFAHHSEPPFPSLVIGDCLIELFAAKVGPKTLADDDLGICELPEKKIADPEFPARPDKQVGIGNVFRREVLRNQALVDFPGVNLALLDSEPDRTHGPGNVPPPAVAQREAEMEAGVGLRFFDRVKWFLLHFGGE